MKCRKCGKRIIVDRQSHRGIGKRSYNYIDGYTWEAYEHTDCNAPLIPESKSYKAFSKNLCKELNKIIK